MGIVDHLAENTKQPVHPSVSIVTPAYNAAAFIRETIESVRSQNYSPTEHIVIDGGSTDGTVDILRQYSHLVWVSEPDLGQSHALNKGFRRAQGEIIGWLNADDTYQPGAIRTAVSYLQQHPDVDVVYSDCQVINGRGHPLYVIKAEDFTPEAFLFDDIMPQPTIFLRRRVIEEAGTLINESLHYVMDWEFCLRIASRFSVRRLDNVILANFRLYCGTKSSEHGARSTREFLSVLDDILSLPPYRDLPPPIHKLAWHKAWARHYMTQVFSAHAKSDFAAVRSALLKAVRHDPTWLRNRGVIAIATRAFLGQRAAGIMRRVWGVVRPEALKTAL
jgi:glycosyltransferase involved in cell wall biosynthesis